MNSSKLILTCCLFICFNAHAQTDTTKVNELLQQSTQLLQQDGTKSLELASAAKVLAQKIGFKKGEAIALKNMGIVYNLQGKYLEVLDYWNASLKIFTEIKDKKGIANLLSNIGTVYNNSGDNIKALDYFLKGSKIAEEINDQQRLYILYNNIGNVYQVRKDYSKALGYYLMGIPLVEKMGEAQSELLAAMCVNVGSIYTVMESHDYAKAETYLNKALQAYGPSPNRTNAYNYLGELYVAKQNFSRALHFFNEALSIAEKSQDAIPMIQSYKGVARTYVKMNSLEHALEFFKKAEQLASTANIPTDLSEIYQYMSHAYAEKKDFSNAFKYQNLYTISQDSLYRNETNKKLGLLQFDFDIQKKQGEVDLLTKDKKLKDAELNRQRIVKNAFMAVALLLLVIAFIIFRNFRQKVKINKVLDHQKEQIETLLLNILPSEVANELQTTGTATPKSYEKVSVLFTDFRSFTTIADKLSPEVLVQELNSCFCAFDTIIEKHRLEKIKTIGDSYMCAGGIPTPDDDHECRIIKAAMEIQEYIFANNQKRRTLGLEPWEIRIGVHVGPVVAGVVGKKKYAYDIWGSTVNIASRMESSGVPGQVNISAAAFEMVKSRFACIYRGKVHAKNVGDIDMYLVDHEIETEVKVISIKKVHEKQGTANIIPG